MVAQPLADEAIVTPEVPSFGAPLVAVVGLVRTAGLALPKGRPVVANTGNLRLAVDNGRLTVAATDLEVYIQASLPLVGATDGDVLVPPQAMSYLERLAAVARDEAVTVYRSEQGRLQLRIGRRGSEFAVVVPDDFPAFPVGEMADSPQVATAELAAALALARATVASGAENAILGSVALTAGSGRLTLASTDGFAATNCTIALVGEPAAFRALLPQRAAEIMQRVLAQTTEAHVRLAIGGNGGILTLSAGPVRIAARLVAGVFPDLSPFRARVPEPPRLAVTVAVADLIEAVRICEIARGGGTGLVLSYRGETLRLAARTDTSAVLEPVACVGTLREAEAPAPLRVDGAKLLGILGGLAGRCPGGLMTLAYEDPLAAPALLIPGEGTDGEDFALLMGMS